VLTAQLHKLQSEGGNFELAQVGMLTIGSGALLCKQADEETCIVKNEMDPQSISYLNLLLVFLQKEFICDFILEPTSRFRAKIVW
jgi:hypothetical protein